MYLVQHSRNLVFVVLVRKMTADAVHGESQDGIRLFCAIIKVQKYNRRIVTVHTVTENGNL